MSAGERVRALFSRRSPSPPQPDEPPALADVAASYWDAQSVRQARYWAEHPLIREYVNTQITGVPWLWPLVALKAGWTYHPLRRAISIGCGTGALERSMRLLNVATKITGYDVSRESIRQAKALAKKEGLDGLRYEVRNCDALELPKERFNGAFFHQSLHHIADPDRLLAEVRRSLVSGGLVYVDDYVGPGRDEWTDADLVAAREAYETVPDPLRVLPVNPPLDSSDPSEMIRSGRILPALRENFEILHYRPYWGNLLFPLFCAIDGDAVFREENTPLVREWIAREQRLVEDGTITAPLFAVVVARKRE